MSHFTTIKTQIRDVEALSSACKELKVDLLQNADARGFNGELKHGDYVIKLNGPYDIAVNPQPDGTFGLTTDWWAGHVEQQVGSNYSKLLQLYAVHKATREAKKKGFCIQRRPQKDGAIKLILLEA